MHKYNIALLPAFLVSILLVLLTPFLYIYTGSLDFRVQPSAPPPHLHTSDCPIFKIPFDSENTGKLMRHYIAKLLIFAIP